MFAGGDAAPGLASAVSPAAGAAPVGASRRQPAWSAARATNSVRNAAAARLLREHVSIAKLTPLDERARLYDVNLPAHVDPLDVLLAPAEDGLDPRGGARQLPDDLVGQHGALARDGHLLDAARLVEGQEALLLRARQDFDRVGAREVEELLGDALALDHLDPEAAIDADVDGAAVVRVERGGRDHHARAVGVDALLHEHGHVRLRVVDVGALARLVRLEVPERRPDGLDGLDQLLVLLHVRHRVVEAGAVEVRQVFHVRAAAHEEPLARVLGARLLQKRRAQLVAHLPLFETFAHGRQPLAPVRRVVDELLVAHHLDERVFEPVLLDEAVVIIDRNPEAAR